MNPDCIQILQSACADRNEARGQAKDRELATASAAASAAVAVQAVQSAAMAASTSAGYSTPAGTPGLSLNTTQNMLFQNMLQKLQQARSKLAALRSEVGREGELMNEKLEAIIGSGTLEDTQEEVAVERRAHEKVRQAMEAEVKRLKTAEREGAASWDASDIERYKAIFRVCQRCHEARREEGKRFREREAGLLQRLQDACAQRDSARDRVNELELATASAATSTGWPIPAGVPVPAAGHMQDMLPKLQQLPPGYLRTGPDKVGPLVTEGGTLERQRVLPCAGPSVTERSSGISGMPTHAVSSGPESETDRRMREAQVKQVAMLAKKQKAQEERLLAALAAPLPHAVAGQDGPRAGMGFHKGRPVAAIVIFRYCLYSLAFQSESSNIFDRISSVIQRQVERGREDNSCLAYWLCTTATLLHMLNTDINPSSAVERMIQTVLGSTLGGRSSATTSAGALVPSLKAPTHGGDVGGRGSQQVGAKEPALLFMKALCKLVEKKIFPMIRDNVCKEILPMLKNCIPTRETPLTPRGTAGGPAAAAAAAAAALAAGGPAGGADAIGDARAAEGAGAAQRQAAASQESWTSMLRSLDALLTVALANHVPKVLVQALFRQLFRFINVQLFNRLLMCRCSLRNGQYLKAGLETVAHWISGAGADYIADPWEELKYLRQAVTFLVIDNKPKKSLEEIRDLCPVLSICQLHRMSTVGRDDYNMEAEVSQEVLGRMVQALAALPDSNSSAGRSFLLTEDPSRPLQLAELLLAEVMDDKDLYGGIPVPEVLHEGDGAASFAFLENELHFAAPAAQ